MLFPAICLMELTLPAHFGWEEWTTEALFYKRPKLHAWFEVMRYETPAAAAEQQVAAWLARQGVDWQRLALDCPTRKRRSV